ncbi:glycosyltransferase family 4 protein [Pontibacter litorisediminis]|uniref:glycosyltransferase family 4 protein n=1 Tax=Pontibacter litorisediminis TaxID=1846260 RepID=UPI0023ECA24E|nr:glycosyltransferase family 4 protein [Pontibacter litorisediminis]
MAKFLFYDDKLINILQKDERPSGGAAVQTLGWIQGLSKAGQEIYVLTGPAKDAVIKEQYKEFNIIPLYDQQKGVRWIRWVYYRLPYIYKKVRSTKPDYLYQSIPGWSSFLIGSLCRYLKIRYVLRISNDNLTDERFFKHYSRAHHFFLKSGMKLAYCILCQNEYQLENIKKKLPGKYVVKLPNPILLKPSQQLSDTRARGYIAWVGLFQYQKNLKLLYEIASSLQNEQFWVAGKELPKLDNETVRYLEKLRQLPNVKFVGFLKRNEVQSFIANAKFLLNTSYYEGFSNTFLEAMAVGTPIISSSKVNPDGFITTNCLGIVYENAQDLARQYAAVTASSYELMSKKALQYVSQHHSHDHLARRLLDILNEKQMSLCN